MRKVILCIPITLDRYIEGPHQERDWVIPDDELHNVSTHLLENADTDLFGRVTYELYAGHWPTATNDSSLPKGMLQFINTINPMPKIVFSKTLKNVGWHKQVVKYLLPEEIIKMKAQPGRDMVLVGGASITQAFMRHRLIDEYQLLVHPAAIGRGKPLFSGSPDMLKMEFLRSQTSHSSMVALCYQSDGRVRTNS